MPDPEIELPRGTELILRIESEGAPAPEATRHRVDGAVIGALQRVPVETTAADIINVAFAATEGALVQAFEAAGWTTADALSARTAARTYKAFTSMGTYAKAPVSRIVYQGKAPDLVFQKSFNSLSKRHHIRLWRSTVEGDEVWLGAATHDVAIAIDWRAVSLTHKIDPAIDRERRKVVNDLRESGCIAGVVPVARPDAMRDASKQSPVFTDGSLALVTLQPCESIAVPLQPMEKPRRRMSALVTRRLVMETRQYITRGNPYYWAYRGAKWLVAKR